MLFEFYYQRRAKIFYLFLAISILLSSLMFFSQVTLIQSNLTNFEMHLEEATKNEEDVHQLLSGNFSVTFNNNVEQIDNPLKYYYMAYQSSLVAMNVKNGINQLLSSSYFIIFPFIAGIYGIIVANSDIKYHTTKIRLSLDTQWKLSLNKILASLLSIFFFLFASIVIFLLLQYLSMFFIKPEPSLNIDGTLLNQISYLNKAPVQLLVIIIVAFMNFIFCFYLTAVTRNTFISLFLLGIYNLILPPLGKYDLKNILLTIYPSIFNTNASTFRANVGQNIELGFHLIIISFLLLLGYIWLMEYIRRKWSIQIEK